MSILGFATESAAANVLQWFTGGAGHHYHKLYQCMGGDTLWVAITVAFDLMVASGYAIIAWHWWQNQRRSPNTPAKSALRKMRNIFLFCAFCGYVFIPVKMFWPAWRLYDIFMAFLVYNTWSYAWGAKDLKVIYNELGQTFQLKEELARSQRQSREKTFFLNSLSHDLRTPLNGVMLQSQVAKMSAESGDLVSLRQAIHEIEAGAKVTAELLDNLLQCARLDWVEDPVTSSTFDLTEVLDSVESAVRAEAVNKGIDLTVERPHGLEVVADRMKLERILLNLVNNAVKFTQHGSVRLNVEVADRGLEIDVIDTGPGISPEHQAHIFDEFYQVKNCERDHNKGFGLGLAIARRMARKLGGDIELDSAPGSGSRFSLVLPGIVRSLDGRADAGARYVDAAGVGA